MQALVAAALARFTAAAGPPPTTEPLKEEDQRRRSDEAQDAMEQDEEPEFVGAKEAREVGPQELGVADKAGPKTGEVETCRHWAKGCCMQVDACRYAHPQTRVPRGVPQDLLLILQAMARVGALSLDRSQSLSRSHGTLLREVVAKAQGGGPPPQRGTERNRTGQEDKEEKSPRPHTSAAPLACIMLAACILRRKDNKGAPPPHTPTPTGRGRRRRGDGMRAPHGQSSWVGRQQGEDEVQQGRASQSAHTKLAPNGGNMPGAGTQGTKGDEGSHTANPPPTVGEREEPKRAGRPRREEPLPTGKCRASCLHRARSVHAPEDRQQGRPPPPHPHPPKKGTRTARRRHGDMGRAARETTAPEGETGGKRSGRQAACTRP